MKLSGKRIIVTGSTEGIGAAFAALAKKRLAAAMDEASIAKFAAELVRLTNRTRTNGGPLFGVNSPVILGHGSSRADEILAAVTTAVRYVQLGMVDIMREDLASMMKAEGTKVTGSGAGR